MTKFSNFKAHFSLFFSININRTLINLKISGIFTEQIWNLLKIFQLRKNWPVSLNNQNRTITVQNPLYLFDIVFRRLFRSFSEFSLCPTLAFLLFNYCTVKTRFYWVSILLIISVLLSALCNQQLINDLDFIDNLDFIDLLVTTNCSIKSRFHCIFFTFLEI